MKKILIIDDEESFNFFVKKNLESAGEFKVITCSDSGKGFELACEEQPNLILLDILMPNVSGTQLAEDLKADERTASIPIVFLTAVITQKETDESGNLIGGRYFVAKPVRIGEIVNMIKTLAI